jgi:hypothetical protein
MKPFLSFLLVASMVSSLGADAQQPVKRTSRIVGVALDSLHLRPLVGADVMISGVTHSIVTDSIGRFEADSLPAGNYQVGLFHPLLDSLGISLGTPVFALGPDSTSLVTLTVPPAQILIAQTCKARLRTLGNSVIFGRLLDPDTFEPIPNAEVSVAWTEYEVSKETGVRQTPRLLRDSTDAQGDYRICGLPTDLNARLQARYRGSVTADVPVQTSSEGADFLIRPLYISRADSGARNGKAMISGRVTFTGGQPASASRVEIVGSTAATLTDERGEFSLSGAPSGTQMLLVRHLGWTAREVPVDLSVSKPQQVAVQLQKYVPMMDPVVVTARAEKALDRIGFTERQKSGMGHFLNAKQIDERNAFRLSDILRTVPGLRVQTNGTEDVITSTRGGSLGGSSCVTYYVDGMAFQPLSGGDANDFVNPNEVAAIEVYQASFVPAQFMSPSGQACTTIVVWTKQRLR